jgi:hypothetical protein
MFRQFDYAVLATCDADSAPFALIFINFYLTLSHLLPPDSEEKLKLAYMDLNFQIIET